jgi:hypothetical protein
MPYRILSLDGGGAWSLIQLRTLISLYGANTLGHTVLKAFDLIAANAGGSLVLAGLAENRTLGDLLALFMDDRQRAAFFPPTRQAVDAVLPLLPNTGSQTLQQIASDITGPSGRPMHLLVIGFDYQRNRVQFFRSRPAGGPEWGAGAPADITLAAVVRASMHAPIGCFEAPPEIPLNPDRFWDGEIIGCNNPLLAAVVEAITLDVPPGDIRALSLGTGMVCLPPAAPFTATRDGPPDTTTFIAHAVTGGADGLDGPAVSRVVRFNPLISPVAARGRWTMPRGWTMAQFQRLCGLGIDALAPGDVAAIDDWCQLWLGDHVPNQPIRMDGETLMPELGYGLYSEARRAWRSLFPRMSGRALAALVEA